MPQLLRASYRLLTLAVLCGAISGCMTISGSVPAQPTVAPLAASPVPGATTIPQSAAIPTPTVRETDIQIGIQDAINRYAQAYSQRDAELLKQAVDQSNPPFRRFMQTRFEGASQGNAGDERSYQVRAILKYYPYGFVLARIESDGKVSDVTFRRVDDRWILSEPTEAQIGERRQVESEHFTFYIYPWLDDINPTIIATMEQARTNVQNRLGKVSAQKPIIHVKPIFGVGSPEDASIQASYHRDDRVRDRIELFAPQSYAFGFYDPAFGWEKALEQLLTHEYTHLVNDRMFIPLSQMSDWMVEGLAEYIANLPHTDTVRAAVQAGRIIPIVDTSTNSEKYDLQHLEVVNADADVTYGFAYALVAYISEHYGGLDGFWKLADAYAKTQNLDTSLQQAYGIDYATFDSGWRAWLQTTYH